MGKHFDSPAAAFMTKPEKQPEPQTGAAIPEGYRLAPARRDVQIHVLLPADLRDRLRTEAAAKGKSMNGLINDILAEYLRKG